MYLHRQGLSHLENYTLSNVMVVISSDNISWEIYCDQDWILKIAIQRPSRPQASRYFSHLQLQVRSWFMDGMLYVDTFKRRSNLTSMHIFPLMKDIPALITKIWEKWGKLFSRYSKSRVWMASKDLPGITRSSIELIPKECTNARRPSMET